MNSMGLSRFALTFGAASALLAGCGGSQPPIGAPGALQQSRVFAARPNHANYEILYSFGAPPDGNYPGGNLIDVGGTLYGTTRCGGGSYVCDAYPPGGNTGTVFSITMGGTEQVLHGFNQAPDGSYPRAGLTDVGGTLFGTTEFGGATRCNGGWGCGTVFSISTGGTEKVVHSFRKANGENPVGGLVDVGGTLYGTTGGDEAGAGTVFSITPSGRKKMLHKFGSPDGTHPFASMIYVNGSLYGTTAGGGAYGKGTVFSITPGGTEKVLHSFNGTDGAQPYASLIDVDGTFYGTTAGGGAQGKGTVFSITPSGTEKVLHSFKERHGAHPYASLIDVDGTFYGTTEGGGARSKGTVFSVTPGGTERVLHSFGNADDGANPTAALIDLNDTLYGTTVGGGKYGYGTVFALTP